MTEPTGDLYLARFREHPFHSGLAAIRSSIETLQNGGTVQSDPQASRLNRLARAMKHIDRLLSAVDGSLAGLGTLTDINNATGQLHSHIQAFAQTANDAQLVSANEIMDTQLLPAVRRLPLIESPADVGAIFSALDVERKHLQAELKSIQEDRARLNAEVMDTTASRRSVDEQIAKQESRLEALVKRTDDSLSEFNSDPRTRSARATSTSRPHLQHYRGKYPAIELSSWRISNA